jgi:hypothetical protein
MDAGRSEFLTSMIDILERLQQTCVKRGEPLLGSVLTIAKGEAEDALRHAEELASLHKMREKMSSQTSWRPEDQARLAADLGYPEADGIDSADDGEEIAA